MTPSELAQLHLDCLRLAGNLNTTSSAEVLKIAQEFYDFVTRNKPE